jgi:hypothetical protein
MRTLFKLLIISVVLVGCEKKVIDPLDAAPYDVGFQEHLQPYFTESCISCHNSPGSAGSLNLKEGFAYESIISGGKVNVDSPKESVLYNYVNDGHQGLTDKTKASEILKWVMDGALDN